MSGYLGILCRFSNNPGQPLLELLRDYWREARPQIQNYETGTNRIGVSRMRDIAAAMEVPVSFFFEGLDGQAPNMGKVQGDPLTDRETLDLVRTYYAIPKNQRRCLFDLAYALAEPT